MKKLLFVLTLVSTINVFSQTIMTDTLKFSGSKTVPLSAGNVTADTFSLTSTTNFTLETSYIAMGHNCGIEINDGLNTYTIYLNPTSSVGNGVITTVINKTSLNYMNFDPHGSVTNGGFTSVLLRYTIGTSGLNELNTLPVNFYSVSNLIYIDNNPRVKIHVFNLSGELIYSNEVSSNKIDLNVSNGLYVVKLSKDNQYSIKKIIINN